MLIMAMQCSRFSKFVMIQFGQSQSISGATIETCLLEKSRVCHISNGERNYHIFYRLCAAPPEVILLCFVIQAHCQAFDNTFHTKDAHW